MAKCVAKRGSSTYLLDMGNALGVVVDVGLDQRYPPFNLQSIFARGYWIPTEDDPAFTEQLLQTPEYVGAPPKMV